jgi:DNA polymerase III delta prime subunit
LSASSLEELSGLAGAKRAVEEFSKPDCGVHAVLFYGAEGVGKGPLARTLARNWLTGGNEDSPAARLFDQDKNPDYVVYEPMGPSRILREVQMRSVKFKHEYTGPIMLEFIRTPPISSAKKVVHIVDADRFNADAANVVLKSLEEPHDYLRFVLTTTMTSSLPATILSRCLAVACEAPPSRSDEPLWILAQGVPGKHESLKRNEECYQALWRFAQLLPSKRREGALLASEVLRGISDEIQKATELGARAANCHTLELFAIAIRSMHPELHHWLKIIAEAHRRIGRNGSAALIFDSMVAELLAS